MVCFHPILTWTKRDNLASKKYYPLSLNCLARCRAEFWSARSTSHFYVDSELGNACNLHVAQHLSPKAFTSLTVTQTVTGASEKFRSRALGDEPFQNIGRYL